MICAENVDEAIEPALALVEMVGNVRGEVRPGTVLPDHDAVLLVAEVARPEPGGAVLLVKHAPLFEHGERIVDAVAFRQALLGEPAVEGDTELGEVFLDIVADAVERLLAYAIEAVLAEQLVRASDQCADVRFLVAVRGIGRNTCENGFCTCGIEPLGIDGGGDVFNVVTPVTRGGKRYEGALRLQPA